MHPSLTPPDDALTAMAYDNVSQQIIFFGGLRQIPNSSAWTPLNETWAFSAGSWSQLRPPNSPPPIANGVMTFDSAMASLVLYADARLPNGSYAFQTWTYHAGNWTMLGGAPLGRPFGLAYDPLRSGAVLIGEVKSPGSGVESWILKNSTWRHLTTGTEPTVSSGCCQDPYPGPQSLVYDPATGYLLLVIPGPVSEHTWKFSHGQWTQLIEATHMKERKWFGMTFDSADGYAMLFGGESDPFSHDYDQTWTF
jgi:hypothetical protein